MLYSESYLKCISYYTIQITINYVIPNTIFILCSRLYNAKDKFWKDTFLFF